MGWTERQRQMLAEMGLRVWAPDAAPADAALPAVAVDAPAVAGRAPVPAPEAVVTLAPAAATPHAGAAGIADMDWPALREAVAACRACRLCEGRRNTVFGVGNEQAHLMVVGEAPGEQEDRKGEPFVGPAGHLLDSMLRSLNLTREEAEPARQVFIANTLKCRPPGNRNPEPDEMVKCEPFLKRQLALVKPRAILAMGRFAVQALLRSGEPIGRLRGRVHTYEGVPLVVTYHPAYLLRNLPDKAKAWEDLCLVARVLEKGPG
jgi:DNA polymerase